MDLSGLIIFIVIVSIWFTIVFCVPIFCNLFLQHIFGAVEDIEEVELTGNITPKTEYLSDSSD